jgi:hypothetical protein
MRNLLISLLLATTICCTNENSKDKSFDLIDLSVYDGWMNYFCIKVYNDGQTYILNSNHRKGDIFLKVKIGAAELDSIDKISRLIKNQRIDTLYFGNCADCYTYNLLIKSKQGDFHSHVQSVVERKEIILMDQLVYFLHKIGRTAFEKLDSAFYFESRTREFYPIPPPPLIEN